MTLSNAFSGENMLFWTLFTVHRFESTHTAQMLVFSYDELFSRKTHTHTNRNEKHISVFNVANHAVNSALHLSYRCIAVALILSLLASYFILHANSFIELNYCSVLLSAMNCHHKMWIFQPKMVNITEAEIFIILHIVVFFRIPKSLHICWMQHIWISIDCGKHYSQFNFERRGEYFQ